MSITGKSARGEIIDFDLLKIKQQIASAPPSSEVSRRKDFIENRLRRRTKKVEPVVAAIEVDKPAPEVAPAEDVVIEKAAIEKETTETTTPKKTTSKQKARATKTSPEPEAE